MLKDHINRFLSKPSAMFSLFAPPFYLLRFFWFTLTRGSARYLRYYPGHFASTIPSGRQIRRNADTLFDADVGELPGIELHEQRQLTLLQSFKDYYEEFPFPANPDGNHRYYHNNNYFRFYDGFVLYAILRQMKPRRILELGSGFSSALVLDVNDRHFDNNLALTFVEPYPQRLNELIRHADRTQCEIIEKNIEDVSDKVAAHLESGDVLFVDTSHVLRIGGDLSRIFNEIIPNVPVGGIVHIHDIFWPFEYPRNVIMTGRLWNESYIARAFLQFNTSFEILFWNDFVAHRYPQQLHRDFPRCADDTGASLWLRRVR